jgi:hypothetical protein
LLDLENNQINKIKDGAFNALSNILELRLSNNQINEIEYGTFNTLKKLELLNLENNQINEIKDGTFNGLTSLSYLYLENNQINEINKSTFNTLTNLKYLNLHNNQINEIKDGTFNALTNLLELCLSNNQINKINKDIFKNLKKNCSIDFRDNLQIQINDMDFMFDFFFEIIQGRVLVPRIRRNHYKKDEFKSFYRNNCIHTENEDDLILKIRIAKEEESIVKYLGIMFNCEKDVLRSIHFLTNKSHYKGDYENKVLLFYLNLSTWDVQHISGFKKYETFLDFVINNSSMIDYSFIINFKKYIDNYLEQNKQIRNFEFKLKSPETLEHILERDNLMLFETFFELEIKNGEISVNNKYIFDQKEFYEGIKFDECFKKVLEKNNEKMAIYLFRMMSFIFKKWKNKEFLHDFNKNLIKTYLKEVIKDKKWYNLTKEILDLSKQFEIDGSNFFYLIEKIGGEEIIKEDLKKLKNKKDNPISKIDQNLKKCSKSKSKCLISSYILNFAKFIRSNEVDSSPNEVESGHINNTVNNNIQNSNQTNRMPSLKENNESNNNVKNKDYDKYNDNILKLINKTKNFDLLNHETTQKMLDEKYKYLPSFIYHSKLTLLLVFLIFYSINISIYYIGDTNSADLTFKSKIICYIILSIFIIIENFQFINSVKNPSSLLIIK